MKRKLYQHLAMRLQAIENCVASKNEEWAWKHRVAADVLCRDHMPSGSGIDRGTSFDVEGSYPDRLVFITSFHHMNDVGYYVGWTEHTVVVTPSLANEFDLRITGRDRNQIKDYLADVFRQALCVEIDEHDRGGDLPEGVTAVGLDDPKKVHETIAVAVGEGGEPHA